MTIYNFQSIDVPAAAGTYTDISVNGVDAAGEAVGNYGYVDGDGDQHFHGLTASAGSGSGVTFDPPGSSNTDVIGITAGGKIFGDYTDFKNQQHGFVDNNGVVTVIDAFLASSTTLYGIADNGELFGGYTDHSNGLHGFVENNGVMTTIDVPGAASTTVFGVDAAGEIVGAVSDSSGAVHGFLDNNGVATTFDAPNATNTYVVGVSASGEVAGNFSDAGNKQYAYVYDNGAISVLSVPGAASTGINGITDTGIIFGYYADSAGNIHGFIDSSGAISPIDVPGTIDTDVLGVNAAGDVFGYSTDTHYEQHGFVATVASANTVSNPFNVAWNVAGVGDFDGDGFPDLAFRRAADGATELLLINGDTVTDGAAIGNGFDSGFNVAAVGAFNDGTQPDLVYRNPTTGLTEIQFLNGTSAAGGGALSSNPFGADWRIVGAGDFNGAGTDDLVFQRASDGLTEIMFLHGTTETGGGVIPNAAFNSSVWQIAGVGDFNGDGKPDLVYHNVSTGLTEIQFLNGINGAGGGAIANGAFGPEWNIVGLGDFTGNGNLDLVYQRPSDGLVEIQLLDGTTSVGGGPIAGSPFNSPDWRVVGVGDFNHDGKADLIYRNSVSGVTEVQFLHGTTPLGGGVLSFG
jgi:hypothetical protein